MLKSDVEHALWALKERCDVRESNLPLPYITGNVPFILDGFDHNT